MWHTQRFPGTYLAPLIGTVPVLYFSNVMCGTALVIFVRAARVYKLNLQEPQHCRFTNGCSTLMAGCRDASRKIAGRGQEIGHVEKRGCRHDPVCDLQTKTDSRHEKKRSYGKQYGLESSLRKLGQRCQWEVVAWDTVCRSQSRVSASGGIAPLPLPYS